MMIQNDNHLNNLKLTSERKIPSSILRLSVFVIVFLAIILTTSFKSSNTSTVAQDNYSSVINREYQIKAVYLYNFCKYIEWPERSTDLNDSFVIGLLESDPFGESLAKLARKKTIKGKQIIIKHIDSMADYRKCHLLFIPANIQKEFVREVLDKIGRESVLIVGEEENFAQSAGIINFFHSQNKIRFEINPGKAEEHNLRISSKLLKLGKIIE